jgi:hypothetical protein
MKFRLLFCAMLAILCAQLHAQSTGIYVNSSNNVGIGTATPTAALDINDNGVTTVHQAVKIEGVLNAAPSGHSIDFYAGSANSGNAANPYARIAGTTNLGGGLGELAFYTNNTIGASAPIEAMRINGSGNVGIGTTGPLTKLHVNYGTNRNFLVTTDATQLGTSGMAIGSFNDGATAYAPLSILGSTISMNGAVGIGTTNPSAKLDVSGAVRAEGGVSLPNNAWIAADDTAGASHLIVGVYGNNFIGFGDITNKFGNGVLFAANQQFLWYVNGNQVATLDSSGNLHANSFIASSGQHYADFVFKPGYKLEPLSAVETEIQKDGHLPGIPSEAEAKAHGIDLASMQVKLLQKIEELTLHQIDQEKRIEQLEKENAELCEKANP